VRCGSEAGEQYDGQEAVKIPISLKPSPYYANPLKFISGLDDSARVRPL
jgi:hypothetical protein